MNARETRMLVLLEELIENPRPLSPPSKACAAIAGTSETIPAEVVAERAREKAAAIRKQAETIE